MRALLDLQFVDYLRFVYVMSASVGAIAAYSLLAYALTFNFRAVVARRFAYVSLCVLVVFALDVALWRIADRSVAERWVRAQWLGIAFLPAAYHGLATAILNATHARTRYRGPVGLALLGVGVACAAGVLFTDYVVASPAVAATFYYLQPGPAFWLFTAVFLLALGHSIRDIGLARARCLTRASRVRMTYLLWGFVAPALGSYPYLTAIGGWGSGSPSAIFLLSIAGNVAVVALLSAMMLAVAYYGVRLPDRAVRYRLVRFAARGPFIAVLVIVALQTIPTVERILGLPRDLVVFSVVTGVIVAGQLALNLSNPLIEFLIYREDAREATWLRELERRLLTPSDVRQFMENHLVAICEFMQAPRGFVASIEGSRLVVGAAVGMEPEPDAILDAQGWKDVLRAALQRQADADAPLPELWAGLRVWPLFGQAAPADKPLLLGLIGVETAQAPSDAGPAQALVLRSMRANVAEALLDRQLQVNVLSGLRHIIPEIQKIQDLRGLEPYPASTDLTAWAQRTEGPDPEFTSWVREALRDLWGGPRLARSPLIRMRVVQAYLDKANGNPHHALRLVLGDAIERMRPSEGTELGQLDSLLHQILDLRFIQGRKVREIARHLAMSESDLYRKQRVAIDQIATIIQEMEHAEQAGAAPDADAVPAQQTNAQSVLYVKGI